MSTTKHNKIVYLSFSLALLVVLRHSINIDIYGINGGLLFGFETWLLEITDIAVPTFFVLSGFLFYQNYNHTVLLRKLKSRFFTLVIPYLIWNLLAYLYYECLFSLPLISSHINQISEPFTVGNIIRNMLLTDLNMTWFLRYLILYTVICPLFYLVLKNRFIGGILLVGVWIVSLFLEIGAYGFVKCSVYYLFGAYLGCNYSTKVWKRRDMIAISVAVLFFLSVFSIMLPDRASMIAHVPIRLLQVISVWFIADLFPSKEPCWWVKLSFFIYCSHSLILESIEKMILILLGKTTLGAWIDLLVAPSITVVLIILLAKVLQKNKKLWSLLTGNR